MSECISFKMSANNKVGHFKICEPTLFKVHFIIQNYLLIHSTLWSGVKLHWQKMDKFWNWARNKSKKPKESCRDSMPSIHLLGFLSSSLITVRPGPSYSCKNGNWDSPLTSRHVFSFYPVSFSSQFFTDKHSGKSSTPAASALCNVLESGYLSQFWQKHCFSLIPLAIKYSDFKLILAVLFLLYKRQCHLYSHRITKLIKTLPLAHLAKDQKHPPVQQSMNCY